MDRCRHCRQCRHCGLGLVLSFYVIVSLVFAADTDCGDPNQRQCLDTKSGRMLYVGETYDRIGECVRVQCLGDYTIWEYSCNVPRLTGDCRQFANNTKEVYPVCCPLYECHRILDDGNYRETSVYDHYGDLVHKTINMRRIVYMGGA